MLRFILSFTLGAVIMACSFHIGGACVKRDLVVKSVPVKHPVREWVI